MRTEESAKSFIWLKPACHDWGETVVKHFAWRIKKIDSLEKELHALKIFRDPYVDQNLYTDKTQLKFHSKMIW